MHRIFISSVVIALAIAATACAQMITSKSVFGQIYSSECTLDAPLDLIMKRLGTTDSLAKIMNFVNKESYSKGFEKVGDAAIFIPFYSSEKNHDYGIMMLTYFTTHSEMRFTYEPMDGNYFFQDLYKFVSLSENKTTISFSKSVTALEYQSPEFIADQTHWIEECLARLKLMVENK